MAKYEGLTLNKEQAEKLEELMRTVKALRKEFQRADPDMSDGMDTLLSDAEELAISLGAVKKKLF